MAGKLSRSSTEKYAVVVMRKKKLACYRCFLGHSVIKMRYLQQLSFHYSSVIMLSVYDGSTTLINVRRSQTIEWLPIHQFSTALDVHAHIHHATLLYAFPSYWGVKCKQWISVFFWGELTWKKKKHQSAENHEQNMVVVIYCVPEAVWRERRVGDLWDFELPIQEDLDSG